MGNRPTPAIVLGHGITALGVIRQLGQIGIPSYVVARRSDFIRGSRWYRALGDHRAPPEVGTLAEWLRRQELPQAVIFPCSDERVVEVAALPEDVSSRFQASVPPRSTAVTLIDKGALAGLLATAGISHPRTETICNEADLARLDDDFLRVAFLKPRKSQAFFRVYNRKALAFDGRTSARQQIAAALDRGFGVVLQEMVPGPASNQVCIDGFVDATGRIRARFARQWLRKFPADFGESCLAVSVGLEQVSEAVELAERVVALLPYRGVFSVELKKDSRDHHYRVLEINVRPWWYVGFTCRAGVNVCHMAYLDALGEPVPDVTQYRTGLYVAYPTYDWYASREAGAAHRDGVLRLLRTWLTAVQPVFSWSDPGPWVLALLERLRLRFSRVLSLGKRPA